MHRFHQPGYLISRGSYGPLMASLLSWLTIPGCNAFDPPPSAGGVLRVVPVDERPAATVDKPLAPIMGGNLLSLRTSADQEIIVVSDPARDRVSFLSPDATGALGAGQTMVAVHTPTGAGSRPNRGAVDGRGFVHIALRGTGELMMLDAEGQVVARNQVCRAPRGVAFDVSHDELVVACAEGQLVRHSTDEQAYASLGTIAAEPDVRDVVVQGQRLYVSRFRSAEILEYTASELVRRHALPAVRVRSFEGELGNLLAPTVAWRMVAAPDGDGVVVLHQRSMVEQVPVGEASSSEEASEDIDMGLESSSYGGSGLGCDGIVHTAVSEVKADGTVTTSDSLAGVVLAVDFIALRNSASELEVVLASAGTIDETAPRPSIVTRGDEASGAVGTLLGPVDIGFASGELGTMLGMLPKEQNATDASEPMAVGCTFAPQLHNRPTTSVLRTTDGLAVLQREPATLWRGSHVFDLEPAALGGDSVFDTGHEIFHRNSGGGIACASCHPEGEDDGHVWSFSDVGARKTQFLGLPLVDTAPFHWDGTFPTLGALMDDVFVTRMGGVFQSQPRLKSLSDWMSTQSQSVVAPRALDHTSEAAARGKVLFESPEVGCATCHTGEAFTNNQSHVVGTSSEPLQVPSLTGLLLHPPYMHNGCAKTIAQRFDPACGGGDAHGKTSHLSAGQVSDLVAYMETL